MAPRISQQEKAWRAESDLRTLTEADKIRNDRARMSAVKAHGAQQVKTISSVTSTAKPKR